MSESENSVAGTTVNLTDITRGLYHAASSTHTMMANQYVGLLTQFFDETKEGTFVPKVVVVQMPDETQVELPLISMVEPKGLMLDKIDFDFAVMADPSEIKEATSYLDNLNLTRSSFKAELAARATGDANEDLTRRKGVVDIRMRMKATEPPEGLMRLFDKFASVVMPVKPARKNSYMPLLSPRFFFIAQVLKDNDTIAKFFTRFNPEEYNADLIQRLGLEMKEREEALLEISIDIDRMKKDAVKKFKSDFEHARIAFGGTDKYDRLRLSQKINSRTRDWLSQATEFYKMLSEDESLALTLHHLKPKGSNPESEPVKRWVEDLERINALSEKMRDYDVYKQKKLQYHEMEAWLRKFDSVAKMLLRKPEHLAKLLPDVEFLNK